MDKYFKREDNESKRQAVYNKREVFLGKMFAPTPNVL